MKKNTATAIFTILFVQIYLSASAAEQGTIGTLIHRGGFVMWPIIILGFIALTITIERFFYFYITGINYNIFKKSLLDKIKNHDMTSIDLHAHAMSRPGNFFSRIRAWLSAQKWNRSAYVTIAMTYIDSIHRGNRSREEALRRTGSEIIEKMERNFKTLSAISHVSPLLGLLGTVTGIINAFNVIAELGGQVDVTALAGGIWEAMLTTAAGLTVAIPAQLGFLYFEKIVTARVNRMNYTITYLDEELFSDTSCNDNINHDNNAGIHASPVISHVKSEEEEIL